MANKTTTWFIIAFLVLVTAAVIIAGAYSSGDSSSTNASSTFVATVAPAITAMDHVTGDTNSKVSVIEYGDYECPACGEYYPIFKQLIADYGDRVEFVFRNYPLYTIHPDAGIGAQAAEAAALQGKFWEMHDILYTNQSQWSTIDPTKVVAQYFNGYASSLGLNVAKFDSDINSTAVSTKISDDVAGGNTAQIDHTPTFFINLQQIPNPNSYTDFEAAINVALASSTASSSSSDAVTVTSTVGGINATIVTTTSTTAK